MNWNEIKSSKCDQVAQMNIRKSKQDYLKPNEPKVKPNERTSKEMKKKEWKSQEIARKKMVLKAYL